MERTPNFYGIVSSVYTLPFGKVCWLGFVCWPPCAKPGNETECSTEGG